MKAKSAEDYAPYYIIPLKVENLPPPECVKEVINDAQWFDPHNPISGGAAGKGPEPPEPPVIALVGSSEYPLMAEDIEIVETNDGKMKMAFAKMQIPSELKSSYILTDNDFENYQDEEPAEQVTDEVLEEANQNNNNSASPDNRKSSFSSPKSSATPKTPSFKPASSKAAGEVKKSKEKSKVNVSPTATREENNVPVSTKPKTAKPKSKELPVSEKAVQLGLYV
jgi:hypothetical protein